MLYDVNNSSRRGTGSRLFKEPRLREGTPDGNGESRESVLFFVVTLRNKVKDQCSVLQPNEGARQSLVIVCIKSINVEASICFTCTHSTMRAAGASICVERNRCQSIPPTQYLETQRDRAGRGVKGKVGAVLAKDDAALRRRGLNNKY